MVALRRLLVLLAFLIMMCFVQTAKTSDLATTNWNQLQHFWQALEQSNAPSTILGFGDSMSVSWRSIQYEVFKKLQNQFGVAGYCFQNGSNRMLWQLGNGASIVLYSSNWWTMHALLPPAGYVFWTNQVSPIGSILCDHAGVFWISHPGGGPFTLSISTNGNLWTKAMDLDGCSLSPEGHYSGLDLPRGQYRIRVEGHSGTNLILGPRFLDRSSTGVEAAFIAQDGANLNQVCAIPTNVIYPILQAINPCLIVWHMKEMGDIGELGLSNRLADLNSLWQNAAPNADIVYIGTPYDVRDQTIPNWTPTANRLVRDAALRDAHAYFDAMSPCVSYPAMTTNGFLYADGIHPTPQCNQFLAAEFWREFGFFALRVNRELQFYAVGDALRLRWFAAPNLDYDLQASTNVVDWQTLFSARGEGLMREITLPRAHPSSVFRLRLFSSE